jgi:hypothetical protein
MIERVPPALALWLLEHWGSPYHGESLAGDLIEQYQEGRSRGWYWKQVIAAVLIARWRFIRAMPWATAARVLYRCLAEAAAVLVLTVVVDRARRTHSLAEMMNHTFIGILVALIAVALIAFLASNRSDTRKQGHGVLHALMLAFGLIALGVGTLTWAHTTRSDACQTPACMCSGN